MNPILTVEVEKFHEVMRKWLAYTSRELSVAINQRMAFMLLRTFVLLPPQSVQAKRDEIKAYMNQPIGDKVTRANGRRIARSRRLQRKHLIAQAKRGDQGITKGLYGDKMKTAASYILRRAVGSVGYLKSALIAPIRKLRGHFTQLGRAEKVSRKTGKVTAKAMHGDRQLFKLLDEYGITSGRGNVAKMRGVKSTVFPAEPSFGNKLNALVHLSVGIQDGQQARVEAVYQKAMGRALADERLEMEKRIEAAVTAAAEEAAS